jgi:DNA-binding transcriptional ArsR family regulator
MVTQQIQPDVYHAVADVTRRAILDRLRQGAKPVNELARAFPVSRPAISKHLRVLAHAHLVSEHREGRHRLYRLTPGPLRDLDRWLNQYRDFWTLNLANLKKHVEDKERGKK